MPNEHQNYLSIKPNSIKGSYLRIVEPLLENVIDSTLFKHALKMKRYDLAEDMLTKAASTFLKGGSNQKITIIPVTEHAIELLKWDIQNNNHLSFNIMFDKPSDQISEAFRPYFTPKIHNNTILQNRVGIVLGNGSKANNATVFNLYYIPPKDGDEISIEHFPACLCVYRSGFLRWAKELNIKQTMNDFSKIPSTHYMQHPIDYLVIRHMDIK
ncbi:hypothetical protein Kuja_1530 [Vibrio phage vB_VchM_Kuja]|uniref:Uncharacterized protein n=1 Tax=Vibrio phage vB_VchM_Kuja TaxID=2686437 RepID=A0A6B9J7W2_9CAUD|nr:hypothetical protein HWC83_gp083 [Vibrio phage vB_VchM_Kuja]QGZ16144.1 hypothetical protein Kuja_1530 [Vibrio phage vB_VchM_Kuja]